MIRRLALVALTGVVAACAAHRAPAAPPAPLPSTFPHLDVPPDVTAPPAVRQRYEEALQRLQAGDLRGASRGFSDVLKSSPAFYPAETGLGYVALADRQYKQAATRFASALKTGSRYLPALQGLVDAQTAAADDAGAIAAIEQLLAVDPAREEMRSRLDLLRMRAVQSQLEAASKARAAGRLEEAQQLLERAVETSPSSAVLMRELARVELARGVLDAAETHARKAAELDNGDADALSVLGETLEAEGHTREAADAFAKAIRIDPRPAWRDKRDALNARADLEALPAEYRAIPSAATVTRGQVAAMIGIELKPVIDAAPKRASDVITDLRGHWAAPWVLPVAQAGVMSVLPNHTFQPNAAVRRADLAQIVSQTLNLLAPRRPADVAAWRAARPRLADVATGYVSYRAIATATAAGAMNVDADGRFWPARPASGEDLVAAVARLRQLAGR